MPGRIDRRFPFSPYAAFVLLFALAVRIVYLIQLSGSDIGEVLPLDMVFYRDIASQMASGGAIPGGVISFNPLYPFFLRAVYAVAGAGLAAPRIVQMAIGIATIYIIYAAARSAGGSDDRTEMEIRGVSAALIAALYPQFILYEGCFLATSLVTFLLAVLLACSLYFDRSFTSDAARSARGRRIPAWAAALIMGAAAGAGSLGRPNLFLLLAAALPVWILLRPGYLRRKAALAALFAAGFSVFILPPVIYNSVKSGEPAFVTTHGGINFYIGNNPSANGLYKPPDGMRSDMRGLLEDARAKASKESGKSLNDAETNDFWMSRAFEWIGMEPGRWLMLLGKKFVLFWNGTEVSDIVDLSFYRKECPVMWVLFLPFTLISALAFPGIFLIWASRKNRSVFLIFLGASLASIMLFYANSRYRVPSVPLLAVLASFSAAGLYTAVKKGRMRKALLLAGSIIVFLFLVSGRKMVEVDKSAAYTFLGNHYMETGEDEKGAKAFAEALKLAPDLVMTRINYARVLLRQGKLDESAKMYASAFEKDPEYPLLAVEYGSVLLQLGRNEDAGRMFMYALRSGRGHDALLACKFLSRMAYEAGNRDEAIKWLEKALEIVPGDKNIENMLRDLRSSP